MNLINRFNNNSSSTSSTHNLTSFSVCTQIGHRNAASRQVEEDTSPFQIFVAECRQPFHDVICGTPDQQVSSKQLRTFLVANFEQGKVSSSEGKNMEWVYQLLSISQRPIDVCKTAYVAVTGISPSALDYAQKQVRKNVSSLGLTLGHDDITAFDHRSGGGGIRSLQEAFDFFGIDYQPFAVNNINSLVDITQIPDNTKAFLCVTYLIDWFGLSGEMEVLFTYYDKINLLMLNTFDVQFCIYSLILTSYI